MSRTTGTIVRKTDTAHTAINIWQCTLARKPLMSIGRRATAATVIGYKVSHLRAPEKLIDVIELGFLLITTISSHLVLLFFLIKSQQRCYLTLIWSQLNPCLNLWRCGAHSNSIQPLTPLRLVSWLWVCWGKSLDTFDCVIGGIICRSSK